MTFDGLNFQKTFWKIRKMIHIFNDNDIFQDQGPGFLSIPFKFNYWAASAKIALKIQNREDIETCEIWGVTWIRNFPAFPTFIASQQNMTSKLYFWLRNSPP